MNPDAVPPAPILPGWLGRHNTTRTRRNAAGKVGAAARAIKTMGFARLVLVRPKLFPDPLAEAMASGATDVLASARVVDSLAEALEGTVLATALTSRRRELATAPLWGRDAARELAELAQQGEVALVFGNETYGLDNDELVQCARWAMIPANPDYASLNLAAAVQLMAYELRQALSDPGLPPPVPDAGQPASHDEVQRLVEHFERFAVASGFLDPAAPKRFVPRLWRLFSRARVEKEEVSILRGLLAAGENAAKNGRG
jgi:tRNA/rRNA methyltransferase